MRKIILLFVLLSVTIPGYAITALKEDKLHDPTTPYGETANKASASILQIDGIFLSKNSSVVTIGGKRFTVSDKVFGAKIVAIKAHEIYLQDDSGKYVVPMNNFSVKQPVTKNQVRETP